MQFDQPKFYHFYLYVPTTGSHWVIGSYVDKMTQESGTVGLYHASELYGRIISASAGSTSPASPEAALSLRHGLDSWRVKEYRSIKEKGSPGYPGSFNWTNGDIKVTCVETQD